LSQVPETTLDSRFVKTRSGFAFAKSRLADVGVPHLRPFNIGSDGELDLSILYFLPEHHGKDISVYSLLPGDVLFNNTSSLEVVGKSALVREPVSWAFSNHVTRLRVVNEDLLRPGWLLMCLRSLWVSGYFRRNATRWIGQAGFNATKLARVRIPIPDVDVQDGLLHRYEATTADCFTALRLLEESVRDVRRFDAALLLALVPSIDQ